MRINVSLPFDRTDTDEFLQASAIRQLSTLLENCGYYGCSVTDHPCPTGRWLDTGGHHAADPFVLLSMISAATQTLRLQTGILVLPYRNPFITARAVATLDVFSGGRVSLGVGAGYLKGEYRALGVDFERRGALMDEYIKALRAAWTNDEFAFQGSGYEALGNRIMPRPLQRPHPPILVGGNSQAAIRRAVLLGDAWYPFFTPPGVAQSARTASMNDLDDLVRGLQFMREYCEQTQREQPPDVVLGSVGAVTRQLDAPAMLEKLDRLRGLGIRTVGIHIQADTRSEWCELAERFAGSVLSKLRVAAYT